MNIQSAYKYAFSHLKQIADDMHHIEFDAVLLLQNAIGRPKSFVFSHPEYKLKKTEERRLLKFIDRRLQFEPIPYIIGFSYFYNLALSVNKNVLIPRPATELLVEYTLQSIHKSSKKNLSIIDVGTGSGAIIIALAKNLEKDKDKKYKFFASDISNKTLKVAKENSKSYRIASKIHFKESDLFSNFSKKTKFDIIVANLPYLSEQEYCQSPTANELKFEPKHALVTEHEGLYIFECFFEQIPQYITKHSTILIEIGYDQGASLNKIAKKTLPKADVEILKDHCGFDRIMRINT